MVARHLAAMMLGDWEIWVGRVVLARGMPVGVEPYLVEVLTPEYKLIVGSSGDGYWEEPERYSEAAVD